MKIKTLGAKSNKNRLDALTHHIDYDFLHRDIIERFIVNAAQFSKDKEYWKNGVFIEFNNAFAIVEVLKENDKNKINIQCFGTNKADLLQKIREEFNKIRTLDKAKEFIFVNNNWQLISAKLDNKDAEKSGFNAQILFDLSAKNQLLLMKMLEKEAKMSIYTEGSLKSELRDLLTDKGKIKDVLNALIQHYLNDLEKQDEARLHLIRINKNEDDNNKGFINYADYKTELNRINSAVLILINDLHDPSVFY